MSLNRFEQAVFDYLQAHPDELRHWENKISSRVRHGGMDSSAVADELWHYIRERGNHTEPFRGWMERGGVPRTSLLNLADYLLRIWGPPVPKRKPNV